MLVIRDWNAAVLRRSHKADGLDACKFNPRQFNLWAAVRQAAPLTPAFLVADLWHTLWKRPDGLSLDTGFYEWSELWLEHSGSHKSFGIELNWPFSQSNPSSRACIGWS